MNNRVVFIIGLLGTSSLLFQNFTPLDDDKLTESTIQLTEKEIFDSSVPQITTETNYFKKERTTVSLNPDEMLAHQDLQPISLKLKKAKFNKRAPASVDEESD